MEVNILIDISFVDPVIDQDGIEEKKVVWPRCSNTLSHFYKAYE